MSFLQKDYQVSQVRLKNYKGGQDVFQIESIRESRRLEETKTFLLKNIDKIIEKNWGKFSKDFISKHIIKANRLKIVRKNNGIVAIASASFKEIGRSQVLYLEFTVVNESVQGYNFTTLLNGAFIIEEILNKFVHLDFTPLNAVTITRNPRVIGAISHFASYVYPNADEYKAKGKLSPANDATWHIATNILKDSWNPQRELLREGNVLIGSYEDSPWLILPKVQKHYNIAVQEMCQYYLDFKAKSDKEFLVHAKFNLVSAVKFITWRMAR